MLLLCALIAHADAAETRRTYDALGNPINELVLDNGFLVSETTWTYEEGQPVLQVTVADGKTTEIRRRYSGSNLVEETVLEDGRRTSRTTWDYEDGLLVKKVVVTPSSTTTTTYRYTSDGKLLSSEVRDGSGRVLETVVSSYAPPKVPIVLTATGGGAYASDVSVTTVTGGFLAERTPDSAIYDIDPLEFSVGVNYAYGRSRELVTQNQLDAFFGIDLNHIIGKTTLFLFTTLERDPVTNLNLDLVVAPVGVKYDFFDRSHFELDASFAPVWNYRSIESENTRCDGVSEDLAEGDESIWYTCASSKLRGSFRVKAAVSAGPVTISDSLEYLPNLLPEDQTLTWALANDSILTNTATLGVALSNTLSLAESFVFERDPTLAAQADCAEDPDNLLCDGLRFSTTTTLSYSQSF